MVDALLVVDHGSRLAAANDSLAEVIESIRKRVPKQLIVEMAHMELAQPDIVQGVQACLAQGATRIVVHPYMLAPGRHAQEDVPRMAREALSALSREDVELVVTPPLGPHPKLGELILERSNLARGVAEELT